MYHFRDGRNIAKLQFENQFVGQHVILTGPSRIPLSLSYAAIRDEAALTFALEDIRDSNDTKANTTQRMLEAVRKYCSNPKLEWTEFFP